MTTQKNTSVIQPYLFFNGRCEEAVNFYRKALGAEVEVLMRFKDSPDPGSCAPGSGEKVMHTTLRIGNAVVMASDGECKGETKFEGFALSLSVNTEADADRVFAALAEGGQVRMPLTKTFWSPRFGMLTDRFGVSWMINMVP